MIGFKKIDTTTINNVIHYSSKENDVPTLQSLQKASEINAGDIDTNSINLPIIKQTDIAKFLQRYTTILARSVEDGVSMDDLDSLQQDFEKLLSTCAVRNRLLRSEIESIDWADEKKENKGKFIEKVLQPPLKRKRPDDRLRYRDGRNGMRAFKVKQHNIAINDSLYKYELSKVKIPRNDTLDKFWSSIEPYCADLSREDVKFLDNLINECSQDVTVKTPDLGEHYATQWTDGKTKEEHVLSGINKCPKSKIYNNDHKKNGLNNMMDIFASPLTQRLLAALLEEKLIKSFPIAFDKFKDFTVRNSNGSRGGVCLDKRLRKELVEQGILDIDELPKTYPPEDNILLEIKKCQQELSTVNEQNISELNKLRTIVAKDLRSQEIKNALNKVEKKKMEIYNVLITKTLTETYDKNNKVISREFDDEAKKLIEEQSLLHRELAELIDFSFLQ